MTVPAQSTLFNESVANGLTTSFPYEFKIASADDITVELDGVAQTTGFTVTGIGEDVGGSIVFSVAPANGVVVLRYLDPVFNREENYPQFGDFNASVVNLDFDRLWLAMQSILASIKRAVKLPVATADDQTIDHIAADRAGKIVGFDVDGNVALLAKVDIGSTIVSGFMTDFIEASTEAVARSIIGAVAISDLGSAAMQPSSAFQPSDADIPTVAASQAEMEAGTEANLRSMSPLRVKQAIAALAPSFEYTSAVTPLPSAGWAVSVAHGVGSTPSDVVLEITCLTAEFGYSIGDVLQVCEQWNTTIWVPTDVWKNATNTGFNLASGYVISGLNKSTGAGVQFTLENWSYRFRLIA